MKDGVDLVNRAGSALTEIVSSIKTVTDIVTAIAGASAEQAIGIEQVNKALTQMDEVTQQNSALVEENAATAKTLEQQSKAMNDEVSVFRVDDNDDHIAAPARPAPAARKTAPKPAEAGPAEGGAAKPAAAPKRAVNGNGHNHSNGNGSTNPGRFGVTPGESRRTMYGVIITTSSVLFF